MARLNYCTTMHHLHSHDFNIVRQPYILYRSCVQTRSSDIFAVSCPGSTGYVLASQTSPRIQAKKGTTTLSESKVLTRESTLSRWLIRQSKSKQYLLAVVTGADRGSGQAGRLLLLLHLLRRQAYCCCCFCTASWSAWTARSPIEPQTCLSFLIPQRYSVPRLSSACEHSLLLDQTDRSFSTHFNNYRLLSDPTHYSRRLPSDVVQHTSSHYLIYHSTSPVILASLLGRSRARRRTSLPTASNACYCIQLLLNHDMTIRI